MVSDHDLEQDRKIAANTEAVGLLVRYMRELRDHFEPFIGLAEKVPEKWAKLVKRGKLIAKLGVIAMILFKAGGWYLKKRHLHKMADRYAEVARRLYYSENNPDVALPFVDKAIEIESENPDYIFFRSYIKGMAATRKLLNLGRPFNKRELDQAHQALAEAVYLQELEPKRPEPYILQCQILAALKDHVRAKEAILKAVELDPSSDFAHLRLAMVQLDEGDVEGAEKSLDRALELNPKSKWAWLWKGILAHDCRKDKDAARACYEKALEIDPRFDMALYNIGTTWANGKERDYAKARDFMQQVLRVNPDYKEACYQIGMFYGHEDNYPVAKVWMDKAIALDNDFLLAYKWRGIINVEMKKYEEAVHDFNAAIQLDPMNADLYVRRARVNESLGRLDDALVDLRFAYDLKPDATRTLLYLGDVFVKAGQAQQALGYYDKAIALNQKYDDAYAHKADVLAGTGRDADALAAIEKAIEVSTYKPERFWLKKGALLEKLKRPSDARAAYVKARTLNPKLLAAWRKEMELAQAAGDAAAAEAAKAKCLELDPTGKK